MSDFGYFFWLANQASGGLVYAWPITLSLFAATVVTLVPALRGRRLNASNAAWSIVPAAVPMLLLTWGVAFKDSGLDADLSLTWQAKAIYALLFAQIPLTALSVWKARHTRLFALALSAFVLHYSFWAAFMAGMSVTNDWV